MKERIYFFYALLIIALAVLIGQAAKLQLIYGSWYREIAEGNRIKKVNIPAPRGIIYDRKGRALVRNIPIYKFKVQSSKFKVLSREEALKIKARAVSYTHLTLPTNREV